MDVNFLSNTLDTCDLERSLMLDDKLPMETVHEQKLGDFGNGLQNYFVQLDMKIQDKINRGIEAAIKIVMNKTIKFIDNRI